MDHSDKKSEKGASQREIRGRGFKKNGSKKTLKKAHGAALIQVEIIICLQSERLFLSLCGKGV
jgi:hypothetical protein